MRVIVLGVMLLGVAPAALAHPGRLDPSGCHAVHERWQATDGTVLERGTYHCHRALGQTRLGERDVLQEDPKTLGRPHPVPRPRPETP